MPHRFKNTSAAEHHDRLASVYRYRAPYLDRFFAESASRCQLGSADAVIDLCCGQGEISRGISSYVRNVYSVDNSVNMLLRAKETTVSRYLRADVNTGVLPVNEACSAIFIGSALHWIDTRAAHTIFKHYLAPLGTVVVSHRYFEFVNPDLTRNLAEINKRFGKRPPRFDLTGRSRAVALGIIEEDSIKVSQSGLITADYLFFNQLSLAYGAFYLNTRKFFNLYRDEFQKMLIHLEIKGDISVVVNNYAIFYKLSEVN